MPLQSLNEWKARNTAERVEKARAALPVMPRSALGIMLQSHAETLGFVARHRRKAALAGESRADRIRYARQWLACARAERVARQS